MMRTLSLVLIGAVVFFTAHAFGASEPAKVSAVSKTHSVTSSEEGNSEAPNAAGDAAANTGETRQTETSLEPSTKTAMESAVEPSQAFPPGAEAEMLARQIEQRRREERERRAIVAKMSLIRLRVRQQFQQNEEWYQDALDEEVEYVRDGEEHFEDKEYRDAKDCYLDAIAITYPQWIFSHETVEIIKTDKGWYKREDFAPSFQKRTFHLSTEYTLLALTRLAVIDRLIAEYDLIAARLKADIAYEKGDLGKAYRLYTHAVAMALKMGRSTFAARHIDDMNAMRSSLFAEAALPLGMAEAALAASRPSAALAAMNEFKEKYADLAFIPELKTRYLALDKNPSIMHERREERALNMVAVADAAAARKDYRTAVRWYRRAATTHADTQAGELAGRKRDALLGEPAVVAAIERQEMEHIAKAMKARAETFASWGRVAEAIEVYEELIAKYPSAPVAADALEARKALEEIAREEPTSATEPPSTEEE